MVKVARRYPEHGIRQPEIARRLHVGISSWSTTLLAAVDAMRPLPPRAGAERAMQRFGGVGNPSGEAHAARLTQRFADLTGARPRRPRPSSPGPT